jgi:hypothetical protein
MREGIPGEAGGIAMPACGSGAVGAVGAVAAAAGAGALLGASAAAALQHHSAVSRNAVHAHTDFTPMSSVWHTRPSPMLPEVRANALTYLQKSFCEPLQPHQKENRRCCHRRL